MEQDDRKNAIADDLKMASLQFWLGLVMLVMFGFWAYEAIFDRAITFDTVSDKAFNIVFAVVMFLIGALIFYNGILTKVVIKRFKKYTKKLEYEPHKSIALLASNVGDSFAKCQHFVQIMVKREYFKNAKIDPEGKHLIFEAPETIRPFMGKTLTIEGVVFKIDICPACGAIVRTPEGQEEICGNCGVKLPQPLKEETASNNN